MSEDPFGGESSPTSTLPQQLQQQVPSDNGIDDQWGEAAAKKEFHRPRVSCPIIYSGPTSRVAFDAIQHQYIELSQSKVSQASSLALRNVVGALASSTGHVTMWLSGKSAEPTPGPSRLVRHTSHPVSGLSTNPFARRVLDAVAAQPTATSADVVADGCLDRSLTRHIHVPCLSTSRIRTSGAVVPQRQDALARFVDVTAAAGSVQLVCCSLDQLHLKLSAEARKNGTTTLHTDRGGAAMRDWFSDIDAALDAAFAVCKDASSIVLFLQQQSDVFTEDELPDIMSTIFSMARVSAADRAAPLRTGDAASASGRFGCGIAAIVVAKIQFGASTAKGAAKGELGAAGMTILCSALNTADDSPFRSRVAAPPPSIQTATHLIQVIEALALQVSGSACEDPCALVPQEMIECDAAIRAARDASGTLTTTVHALRASMVSNGLTLGASRVRMLKLLHLWGTVVVPSFDLAVLEDIAEDGTESPRTSTVCWQPDVLFDAASALASRLAPLLRPDDAVAQVLGTAEQVQQQASAVGFGALTARFWGSGAASTSPSFTTARRDEDDDRDSDIDRVQDRTCVFTAAEAYLMFAPILQQLYAPVRGADDVILVSEVEMLSDVLAQCGLVIKLRRRKVAARTSSDAAFDDRMQRYLAPPFVARLMPRAIPHFFAVIANASGRPSRWVRTNLNPCSVLGALAVLLNDRLALTSVCFGAEKPQNAVSLWANAIVFSSVDAAGRQSRTLVAAPIDMIAGSPLSALLVSTVAMRTDDDPSTNDVGFATVLECLALLSATAMPGLASWESTPCPTCLKAVLPSPETDWVAGWISTASSQSTAAITSSLLSASSSVWFFSEVVLQELQQVRRAAKSSGASTARGNTGSAFPCPTCSTSLLERSIRSRALKVLVGTAPDDYTAELLPSFLPPICKSQWSALWTLASQPLSAASSSDAAEDDGLFCHAVDSIVKALLFHDTFEKPPPLPPPAAEGATNGSDALAPSKTEDEWDHIEEAA